MTVGYDQIKKEPTAAGLKPSSTTAAAAGEALPTSPLQSTGRGGAAETSPARAPGEQAGGVDGGDVSIKEGDTIDVAPTAPVAMPAFATPVASEGPSPPEVPPSMVHPAGAIATPAPRAQAGAVAPAFSAAPPPRGAATQVPLRPRHQW